MADNHYDLAGFGRFVILMGLLVSLTVLNAVFSFVFGSFDKHERLHGECR